MDCSYSPIHVGLGAEASAQSPIDKPLNDYRLLRACSKLLAVRLKGYSIFELGREGQYLADIRIT
ncbi:hypothetical protein XFF6990_90029 [Xanthomonas citri pv. fuscans]|uniref:Uncharacterized protein n=1 Tax=Xanthomonas campestris pv. phaseoli TaxID=317013 RepID=A0A7Z7IYJ8_XANCH|nr:hypothetical protein XFF6990_90029 [Xanthomonas citri pv. fuscans]SOO23051.1 hypothetical protein XFF6991_180162 [Xanthomonas phaseoli pv. phaseoli]